jgi:hypothetical protein
VSCLTGGTRTESPRLSKPSPAAGDHENSEALRAQILLEDRDAYRRLAEDAEQDQWYSERIAPHVADVRWIDGTWQRAVQPAAPLRIPTPATGT